MTPQERELLSNLFDRLRQCEGNPKEPEAAAFIADAVARQPDAPYFMAQLLLVQDQALSAAQARIRALEQAAEATKKAVQQTAAALPASFRRRANTRPSRLKGLGERIARACRRRQVLPGRKAPPTLRTRALRHRSPSQRSGAALVAFSAGRCRRRRVSPAVHCCSRA